MKTKCRKFLSLITVLTLVLFAATTFAEEKQHSATVSIESTSIAIGIGVQWGEGVLKFRGLDYKFKIKGLSVVDLGVSSISAVGKVYNLKKVSDLAGTFTAAEAGIAVGGGAGATTMKNQNGVVMNLTSAQSGIKFKLAPEGIKVTLK